VASSLFIMDDNIANTYTLAGQLLGGQGVLQSFTDVMYMYAVDPSLSYEHTRDRALTANSSSGPGARLPFFGSPSSAGALVHSTMYSVRSSWSAALHDNNAIRLVANGSRRAFSRSAVSHKRALPVFLEASSPQLSSLLTTTNAKVLLPRHFTKEQAQLVFKPANRARIEAEPLEITIGDVTLTLEHIDVNKDIPSYKAVFRDVIRSSKSPEDWENVLRLMEGFRNAGIPLKIDMKENVVRSLSKAGMSHLILKALQRPEHTGLTMTEWGTVRQILIAVRHKATQADWEKEDLKKALKMAELVVEMMEKKPHQTKQDDFRMHPVVVALPLEMASELAYRHDGEIEKVKKYAARLMGVLQDDKTINVGNRGDHLNECLT